MPFTDKEILEHKIKLLGKPWVEDRIKAYKSVQKMKEYLNSLSEEEAHKQAIAQAEKPKNIERKEIENLAIKLFWHRYSKQFYFWNTYKKSNTFAV